MKNKNFLEDENNKNKILFISLFSIMLLFMVVGLLLGYGLGHEIAYQHYQYELNLRDLNLQDKLCIVNNETNMYGKCVEDSCHKNANFSLKILDADNTYLPSENHSLI